MAISILLGCGVQNLTDAGIVSPLGIISWKLVSIPEMNLGFIVVLNGVFNTGNFIFWMGHVMNFWSLIESTPFCFFALIICKVNAMGN